MHFRKIGIASLAAISSLSFCLAADEGFSPLFNGKDFDGWTPKIRKGDEVMLGKVFTMNGEAIHVYKDFPQDFELNTGANSTHGMLFSKKKYSKYVLKFEYKWGKNRLNNFDQYQYDAGFYYHIINEAVWPAGIEYQIRYDHTKEKNHTGDFWASGVSFQWYADGSGNFLLPKEGGKPEPIKKGEHRGTPKVSYHALDDQWNQCEIIVMENQYAIHKLNGKIVNYATNLSVKEGTIAFQAETAEIFYRNAQIKEFNEIVPVETFVKP